MFSCDVLMQSICKRKGIVKVPALVEKNTDSSLTCLLKSGSKVFKFEKCNLTTTTTRNICFIMIKVTKVLNQENYYIYQCSFKYIIIK